MHGDRSDLAGLLQRGFAALERGDVRSASDCCRRVLAAQPDLVQGHFLVGLVALEARDRKTAHSAFGSVTRLQVDHGAAWAHLARLYMSEGQVNRADAALRRVRESGSRDPMVVDLLGTVHSMMGEYEEALACFEEVVKARPEHAPFLLNFGNSLVYHGRTDEAAAVFEKIIAAQPDNPQAHWALASARRAGDHEHIRRIEGLLARGGHSPRALAFYLYAIGKMHEDLEEWDEAFRAFRLGARARRQTVEFDESAEISTYECIERSFTPEWLADGVAGHPSAAPIFILGQPRSGTTLIERIVASHSHVHSAGELQQFGIAVRRLADHRDPRRFSAGLFDAARDVDASKLGGMYLETTRKMQGSTPRFVDKLPLNYLFLPLILKALPRARIIHLTRDPMDACFASFKQLFADAYLHSYDQREQARHHARYRRLMATWRERFPGRFIDVSYEATVSDLEPNARALFDYLELPWEDAVLEFHRKREAVSTASAVQVREPVHTRSVGRWRRYEHQLQPMRDELRRSGVEA